MIKNKKRQEISSSEGKIVVEEGLCQLIGFKNWSLPKATWTASHLMSLCKSKKQCATPT